MSQGKPITNSRATAHTNSWSEWFDGEGVTPDFMDDRDQPEAPDLRDEIEHTDPTPDQVEPE